MDLAILSIKIQAMIPSFRKEKLSNLDMPSLEKCFRRVQEQKIREFCCQEEPNPWDLNLGTIYGVKDKSRVIASAQVRRDFSSFLFPGEASKKKSYALLDEANNDGSEVICICYLFVDPSYQDKGVAKNLLRDLFSEYEGCDFAIALNESDYRQLSFYKSLGFVSYGLKEFEKGKAYFLYRLCPKPGLCRNAFW